MRNGIFSLFAAVLFLFFTMPLNAQRIRHVYMWMDCEANYDRLSSADSVCYYIDKLKNAGVTDVVLDVKSIMGTVVYNSNIAPYMDSPVSGIRRAPDYDLVALVIKECHRAGMGAFASMNIFAGGHNYFRSGILFAGEENSKIENRDVSTWQSRVYWRDKIFPISEMYWNYNAMLNPADPQVQDYELSIIKEFVGKYRTLDGLIFDRMRYDDITSDFSNLSRIQFEKYIGHLVKNWPQDIFNWKDAPLADSLETIMSRERADSMYNADKQNIVPGPLYGKWLEWRAHVIKEFLSRARKDVKRINPNLLVGVYTGAWYDSYYNVGVNWASENYFPKFPWATVKYGKQGYAELLDVYMSGFYYENISDGNIAAVKDVLCGAVPLTGSICVSIYSGNVNGFINNMKVLLGDSYCNGINEASGVNSAKVSSSEHVGGFGAGCDGGVMIFDLSHIVRYGWWKPLKKVLSTR